MSRPFTLPVVIACSAHALLMFGFKKPDVTPPPTPPEDKPEYVEYTIVPKDEDEKPELATAPEESSGGKLSEPAPISIDRPAENITPRDFVVELRPSEALPIKAHTNIIPPGPGSSEGDPNATEYGPGKPNGKNLIFSPTALDNEPRTRVQHPPVYPFSLKANGIDGEVVVEFVVDKRGRVTHPRVLRSTHPDFESATLNAVAKWRFEPGTRRMKPVSFKMVVPVKFSLND